MNQANFAKASSDGLVEIGVHHGEYIRRTKRVQIERFFDGNRDGFIEVEIRRFIGNGHGGPP